MQSGIRKAKIAYIAGQLGLGGAERQLFLLINNLDQTQYSPLVINLHPALDDYWGRRLAAMGITVIPIPEKKRLHRLWHIYRVLSLQRVDLIQSVHYFTNSYAVITKWLLSKPAIGSMKNLPIESYLNTIPRPVQRLALQGVNYLMCNTQASRNLLQQIYPGLDNVVVIPNGIVTPPRSMIDDLRIKARQELNQPEDALAVGFVGRLDKNKNPHSLIQATAYLFPEFPNLRVIVIGDGPLRGELETMVSHLGLQSVIRFYGARPLAEELIPGLDVLCLPSNSEGMPNVVMEAGAAGLPAVASNVGGIPEVVEDGDTGFLFPPGDLEALVGKLRILLQNPDWRRLMGNAARARIQTQFSVSIMVERFEVLYRELLRN